MQGRGSKTEDQIVAVIDVTEQETLPELGSQVVEAMREVREAMYIICSFHNADFQELVDKHELTHAESSLVSIDLLLIDPPYNVRSGRVDASFHYDTFTLEDMPEAVGLSKRVIRSGAHCDLLFLRLGLVSGTRCR